MGSQLWVSHVTGYRRRGTRFSALKDIFVDNVTARSLYDPLLCCPADLRAEDAKQTLEFREFDVAGVKETEDGDVIGYIVAEELAEGDLISYVREITPDLLISDSTPIAEIFSVLKDKDFAFVIHGNHITGIVTKADINKPPVRIYIFGIISLLEMHLNFWINYFYKDDGWVEIIPDQRKEKAEKIYDLRKGNNQDLSLLECLELCDKSNLLFKSKEFRDEFSLTRKYLESFFRGVEKIRNEVAHSQNSIIANIEWAEFINIVSGVEAFLTDSDNKVEKMARQGKEFVDLLT